LETGRSNKYELRAAVLSLILGAIAFFLVVGPRALNPTNLAWLESGDSAQHYIGWLFFRQSEWSFPLGLNPNYGLELSSAIIFSDSNPLLAFLFKPFSSWLPPSFQYFGIWLLACFLLQAWFAQKLVGLISDSVVLRTLGAGMFLFAPPMIWRLFAHANLVGHFFIVAALYLAFVPGLKRRSLAWGITLVLAALVHAYFLAMVGLIWFADILGKKRSAVLPTKKAILEICAIVSVTGIACWQAGYFTVGQGAVAGGYGYYRMNLLSIFDASGWSYILRDIPEARGDYEGFNYLGMGVIFLAICALPALLSHGATVSRAFGRFPILGMLLVGLTIFAVSNKVGFGLLGFKYPLPDQVLQAANIFRASGRMFWPVFYTILFATIFLVVRVYEKRTAALLLGLALLIQIVDTHAGWSGIHRKLMTEPKTAWESPLASPFWREAASRYSRVRWIQPGNLSTHWLTLGAYAGTHGLATDAVYLARVPDSGLKEAQEKASEALQTGKYEVDSLYLLDSFATRQAATNGIADTDVLARIDDFIVLAPGWKNCNHCTQPRDEVKAIDLFPPLKLGERMPLSLSGSGLAYLTRGWSSPEDWGIWSDGPQATIELPLPEKHATSISIEAKWLLGPTHPKQDVEVLIDGDLAAKITLTADSPNVFEVRIPDAVFKRGLSNKFLTLEFHFPDAASPKDLGLNNDTRKLALGLISITVQ